MKLPMKPIIVFVMLTLLGIFAYQAYWLVGLYDTMHTRMRRDVQEAVRVADYEEMMHRIRVLRQRKDVKHGQIDVTVDADTRTHHISVRSKTKVKNKSKAAQQEEGNAMVAAVVPDHNLSTMLHDSDNMLEFGLYMQQGIHSSLDNMLDIDPSHFDSLLTTKLDSLGLDTLHHTMLLHHYTVYQDSTWTITDTIYTAGPARGTVYGDTVRLELTPHHSTAYEVWLPPYRMAVLAQMRGILATSMVILVVLGLVFWYLIRTLIRLRTLDEMKTDFTNNMTHELKTPIAVAYAANDALLNFGALDDREKARHYLAVSQQQLRRLGDMVEQILTVSMKRRRATLHPEPVDVAAVVGHLAEEHRMKATRPVAIRVDVAEGLRLTTDRQHFSNIVSNLMDNAVKYSEGRAEVTVTARRTGRRVELSVADKGVGIAADKLRYVFDKFYRVPHGNLHDVKGYGLGLYYVKTMTEKLGGTVTVESQPGKGSTFKLSFDGQN